MAAKKQVPTKRAAAKKRVVSKKATAKKVVAKSKAAAQKTIKKTVRKAVMKPAPKKAAAAKVGAKKASTSRTSRPLPNGVGRPGDVIVIDSPQVGSPPREGQVLQVNVSDISVSYRVRWADGHETLIAPKSGAARIVPSGNKG